jgi:hypothetical protein
VLASRFAVEGDLELTIQYDMTPNCEIWVFIWDEHFQFKATGSQTATLRRTGDTVVFGSGGGPPMTMKLKLAQQGKATPILLHLDRRNLWRPQMELLIKNIHVKSVSWDGKEVSPAPAKDRPASPPIPPGTLLAKSGEWSFTDEKGINKNWTLDRGNAVWRIETEGLRLRDQNAVLASRFAVKGNIELTIDYDLTDNCEIWLSLWNDLFQFKAIGRQTATLRRTGDTVVFSSGKAPPTTMKLKLSQQELATPILLHMDRRNLFRAKMELLIKRIEVKTR